MGGTHALHRRCTGDSVLRAAGGTPSVKIDGIAATGIAVKGESWITGLVPAAPSGHCPADVTVTYTGAGGPVTLVLKGVFCYAAFA